MWRRGVSGAVWSADVLPRANGDCFVLGTGEGYVYALEIGKRTQKYRRWRAPGAVVSVAADCDNDRVAIGTWQDASICRANLRGRRDWEINADA